MRTTHYKMDTQALPAPLCQRILRHFGLPPDPPPNLETLRQLVARYTRTVPWESASRIARRARHAASADCILLGEAFWESHFALGTGGTCYESNYAFFGLLRQLGYSGYLTINDIGGAVGCHSAIVVLFDRRKYLVDVGFPLYNIIAINPDQATRAECPIMNYKVLPQGANRYQLLREHHPRVHSFLLHDEPVADAEYRAIGISDYRHDGGQFLNEIVIQKVVNEQLWRFHSDERPFRTQQFVAGERQDHILAGDIATGVAQRFHIDRAVVAEALAILKLGET